MFCTTCVKRHNVHLATRLKRKSCTTEYFHLMKRVGRTKHERWKETPGGKCQACRAVNEARCSETTLRHMRAF
jgi:arginyl-tRNA--protein-N-Asp/Glu arginylyltransferase